MLEQRMEKIIDFLKEAEKLKLIERIPYLSDKNRKENDAEHSWYMILMLMTLEKELNIEFDLIKAYKMAAIHDLVEIETGDGWVTGSDAKLIKKQNELLASKKIFGILPEDIAGELQDLWLEFEEGKTLESKVVIAIDTISHTLQYAVSQKIESGKQATHEESRNYAMSSLVFNQQLVEIFESLLDETP